jgi:hypothetical protein
MAWHLKWREAVNRIKVKSRISGATTLTPMAFGTTTLSLKGLFVTLGIATLCIEGHCAVCRYVDCLVAPNFNNLDNRTQSPSVKSEFTLATKKVRF